VDRDRVERGGALPARGALGVAANGVLGRARQAAAPRDFARNRRAVVVDGIPQQTFGEVADEGGLVIHQPTGRSAYVALSESGACVVDNGHPSPWYTRVDRDPEPRIAPEGSHLAYGVEAMRGGKYDPPGHGRMAPSRLVDDGEWRTDVVLDAVPLEFSPDSGHVARVEDTDRGPCVVIDGLPGPGFANIDTFPMESYPAPTPYFQPPRGPVLLACWRSDHLRGAPGRFPVPRRGPRTGRAARRRCGALPARVGPRRSALRGSRQPSRAPSVARADP